MNGLLPIVGWAELLSLMDYCPDTGVFTWKRKPSKRVRVGAEVGSIGMNGYRQISISGRQYKAQRLAWFYVYGAWPVGVVDHMNGIRDDNRIANLRDTTRTGNIQNQRRAHADNSSGLIGAHFDGWKWRSSILVNGRRLRLGVFPDAESAHKAYVAAKRVVHETCTI